MDRRQAISILKSHEVELRALGVEHITVFGSIATDTGTEESDVDVAVTLTARLRGLERVGAIMDVQARLSELLHRPVDVVEEPARSPYIRRAVERDGIAAF